MLNFAGLKDQTSMSILRKTWSNNKMSAKKPASLKQFTLTLPHASLLIASRCYYNTIQQTWHCLLSTLCKFDPADVWCMHMPQSHYMGIIIRPTPRTLLTQHYALIILHWLSLYMFQSYCALFRSWFKYFPN